MIPKAERDADAAILAAATRGTWITAALPTTSPEIRLGSFGPCVDTPRNMPVMVCIQAPGATFGDVAMAEATTSWEQHAANAKAAAHAVNRLPEYIANAAEMERLKTLIAETAQRHEKEAKGLRKKGNADAAALKMAFSEELYRVLGEFWMGPEATKDFERLLRGGK